MFKDETETMPGLQMVQEKLFISFLYPLDSRLGEYYGIRV